MMDKKHKEKIVNIFIEILRFLVPIVATIMVGGMVVEMLKNFQQNQYTFFMSYAQISLTLFGFTLIGAIFETKKKSNIVKRLFYLSLIFLSSSVGFIFLHTIRYLNYSGRFFEILFTILIFIAMVLGFLGFVYGLLLLLGLLVGFIKEI